MKLRIAMALVITLAFVSGAAWAQEIRACVSTKTGSIRIVSTNTACRSGETLLTWNAQGPAGPAGPTNVFAVAVTPDGNGIGTIQSNDGEIDCGVDCAEVYPSGTSIELFATPSPGSIFAGWGGDCAGTGSCLLTVNATKNVTAQFLIEPCQQGATRACPKQLGVCSNSVMVCPASGEWPLDCDYSALIPTYSESERCDGLDNNCNGLVDEQFDVGAACVGRDAQNICRLGTRTCADSQQSTVCVNDGVVLTEDPFTPCNL